MMEFAQNNFTNKLRSISLLAFLYLCGSCSEDSKECSKINFKSIIKEYILRNEVSKKEVFLLTLRGDGSNHSSVKIRTVVYLTQLLDTKPYLLPKVDSINVCLSDESKAINDKQKAALPESVTSVLSDNTKLYYEVTPEGDSLILNEAISHDPEILKIYCSCSPRDLFFQINNSLN